MVGEANDAVSAYTQLLKLPATGCLQFGSGTFAIVVQQTGTP